ncbi:MAG: aspartate dehydrogenase [Eubacterium sp.]|nr:aspartate dehydrogenase [Eubacterium sp.]
MYMFKKKTSQTHYDYDKQIQKPLLKCSICNGEQVAGFKNLQTGKFEEIMLIRNESDLQQFMERCGIDTISKEY